jgi:type II secretory pathway pseudopilin PulG
VHKLFSRRRFNSQEGMTLVELAVSMSMMVVVSVIFLSALVSVQRGVERQTDRTTTNDQIRLALQQLDHEIRSGNLLYNPLNESDPDPTHEVVPNMSLRIYTQANADIRNPGNQCVQWRITSAGELQSRRWATNWRDDPPSLVTSFRVVAENVVNRDPSVNAPAFTLDPDPAKGGRTIVVSLFVNTNSKSGQNVNIKQSVTGRNTEYGYPSNVCADIPPY